VVEKEEEAGEGEKEEVFSCFSSRRYSME